MNRGFEICEKNMSEFLDVSKMSKDELAARPGLVEGLVRRMACVEAPLSPEAASKIAPAAEAADTLLQQGALGFNEDDIAKLYA